MKKVKISVLALAVMALCACTSDDIVMDDSSSLAQGEGYLSFTINLPTETGTRSANDVFDDGTSDEYVVYNATLLLFQGDTEENAKYSTFYQLGTANFATDGTTTDQITTKGTYTQKVDRPSGSQNLYALVVLNGQGLFDSLSNPTTFCGINLANSSLSTFQSANTCNVSDVSIIGGGYNGFYMTNAPLSSAQGGSANPSGTNVTTMAVITNEDIKATVADATNDPVDIYVERGVAKVTLTQGSGFGTLTLGNTDYDVTLTGYILDNTNEYMYPVRNTTSNSGWWGYKSQYVSTNAYRFVGSSEVTSSKYRTYWATDPNYNSSSPALVSLAGQVPTLETLTSLTEASKPIYCLENTFNVDYQKKTETTRAIIAVTIGDGRTSFFCINGDKTQIYDYDNAVTYAKDQYIVNSDVRAALQYYTKGSDDFLANHLNITISQDASTEEAEITIGFNYGGNTLLASEFSNNTIPAVFTPGSTAYNSVKTAIQNIGFAYYEDGLAYYPVLIKHFGDDLTPWDANTAQEENTSYYGTQPEQDFLGRYGVLRNNWYDITVNDVKTVGYAAIPTPENEYDDPIESYIAVAINVLSWAKRTQSVDL